MESQGSFIDYKKLFFKEEKPDIYPGHVPENNNNLFLQMIKDLKAHLISHCEASTLVPYREYLEKHGWTFYFNDSQDFCRLARLGVEGSIRQIGGPNEESQESFFEWSKFAIFEVVWWKAIVRKTFALSSTGYFSRHEDQEYEVMTHMFACHTSVRIPCGQR